MARISIEQEWFSDPRRFRLAEILGSTRMADGAMVLLWTMAMKYWKNDELIPSHAFQGAGFEEAIFECGLAERKPNGDVYVRGSADKFEWYFELNAKASKAGKASAVARKAKFGSSIPKNATNSIEKTEHTPNIRRTFSNVPLLLPLPLDINNTNTTISEKTKKAAASAAPPCFDFNSVYSLYPRKEGKAAGLKTFNKTIKTEQDYQDLLTSIKNYKAHTEKTEKKYIKHFSTFMNSWRDYIDLKHDDGLDCLRELMKDMGMRTDGKLELQYA